MSASPQTSQDALGDEQTGGHVCRHCGDIVRSGACLDCAIEPWERGEEQAFFGFVGAWLGGSITSWGEPVWGI